MKLAQIILVFGVWSTPAFGGDWDDYAGAFPMFPCPDGWATCELDGVTVGPGLVIDAQGNPSASNMRFSFWDFEAAPSVSPFSGLSEYSGDMGVRALKEDDAMVAVDPVDDESLPPLPPLPPLPSNPQKTTEMGGDPIPVQVASYEPSPPPLPVPVAVPDPVAEVPPLPPVEDIPAYKPPTVAEIEAARAAQPNSPPVVVEPAPVEPDPVVASVEAVPTLPPAVLVDCSDLRDLEPKAMLGQLGVSARKCLDSRIERSSKLTEKDKISRVLVSDAKARDDKADWERLMKRHLEQIDRSDPNMCLMFAIHLHKRGMSKATRVIRWADYALENKARWSGAAHTRNVYYLHQLKSQAASRLWKRAEKRFVKDRNEKNEAKANKFRSMAKQYSRAWLDYAKAAGKDSSKPLAACVSASGNTEFCPP